MEIRPWLLATMLAFSIGAQANSQRWKDNGNATLTDTFTGLQWAQHDNLHDVNIDTAKQWCASLSLSGAGWRLPTIQELEEIYAAGHESTPCGNLRPGLTCHVSSLFYLTNYNFWSTTAAPDEEGSPRDAWSFNLEQGKRYSYSGYGESTNRALCVRHP